MKLRTEIEIAPFTEQIDYTTNIVTIGSCFAERVGREMSRVKLKSTSNPTGTLFNPLSIAATIHRLYRAEKITREELHEGEAGWYHYDFHSSLSAPTADETLERINCAIEAGSKALKRADYIVITLGTAWVYELKEEHKIVANCHKEPARNFTRRRASAAEIVENLSEVISQHLSTKKIILTLSPIRHIGDGLTENSLSKATLRVAIEELCNNFSNILYFPSYEILIDDLRDYRFYEADMVHPTQVAVEYIWELFKQTAISKRALETMAQVERVVRASQHRPQNPNSEAHRTLCKAQLKAIERMSEVEFGKESAYFMSFIENNL